MASKQQAYDGHQFRERQLSQSLSAYDFNSKTVPAMREQEQQQTRRRPLSAAPPSNTTDLPLRKLPSLPQVDSGAHSLSSSTAELLPALELSPKGASLIQSFSEAIKSGEESVKGLERSKADNAALREENRLLQQALGAINSLTDQLLKEYLNTPPKAAMDRLKTVKAMAELDPTALNDADMGDYRSGREAPSRKVTSAKKKPPVHKSGTDADAESTSGSSSSPPTVSKHQHHMYQSRNGSGSDDRDIASCKEESSEHIGTRHRGTSEVCFVNTD